MEQLGPQVESQMLGASQDLNPALTKAQFSTIEVAMPMDRWEFRIVPCLAGGNAAATCLKILVMRFANVHCAMTCALSLNSM